ncbi:S26 family signal peptidase [Enhygromyxa salina]|uniref:S26 family signal peptidase n=1 Tax=Enhygromyxa salina TaxID=215803 RepID=UPI000695ABE5|nr:S26 family signal peptidase [Enhygromyxa salina]
MARKRNDEDERPAPPRRLSTKVAYCVLLGGAALVITRASLATLIQVHGDGMAPTILDGESVIMVRGEWGIEAGDLVVYDPSPPEPACEDELTEPADRRAAEPGPRPGGSAIDERRSPRGELHDTAVVDVDDVESNWERVRERGTKASPRNFRVGRVLAVPGDTVTFHVPDVALGLVVNGSALQQKPDDPIRLVLSGKPAVGEDRRDAEGPRLRALAWETLGHTRYPVLLGGEAPTWASMGLPEDLGPIEVRAEGYLILADNRDEGACCDSRAIGWVPPDALRGEVVVRLAGNPGAAPDSDPRSRGLAHLP